MVALIQNNIEAIQDLCKKHHVRSLYLVGSATKEDNFKPDSDVDFLYRFNKEAIPQMDYADNFFDFKFYLEDLFSRPIDLIAEEYLTNPSFIKSLEKSKVQLYAAWNRKAENDDWCCKK